MTPYTAAMNDMKREHVNVIKPSRQERKVITKIVREHSSSHQGNKKGS
jgi:hypothetical protein